MKKHLFFVTFVMLLMQAGTVKAQLGFHAGYAPQTLSVTLNTDIPTPHNLMQGFFGGVHYNRAILGDLGFTAAVQIRMNSATVNTSEYTTQDWQFLADLPLLVNYGFSVGHNITIGAFAGPMLSYGISYTQKTTDAETYEVITSIDRYGTSVPAYALKRFEAAVVGGAFFKYRGFVLFGGYRFGINDLDKMNGCTTRPRGVVVGIAID